MNKHFRSRVVNSTYEALLSNEIDLDEVAASFNEASFSRGKDRSLMFPLGNRVVAKIHGTGKVILFGARGERQARNALHKLVRLINECLPLLSEKYTVESERMRNVVLSGSLDREIDLQSISERLGGSVYTPEIHPWLSYRARPRGHLQAYSNGKFTVTGVLSEEEGNTLAERVFRESGLI